GSSASFSLSRRARSIRPFISAAAASVNVTTSSWSTSHGGLASHTRCAHRAASTAVFPDPAAADTSKLCPVVSTPPPRPVASPPPPCPGVHPTFFAPAALLIRPLLFDHLLEHLLPPHLGQVVI